MKIFSPDLIDAKWLYVSKKRISKLKERLSPFPLRKNGTDSAN